MTPFHSELGSRINHAILPKWPDGGASVINTLYYVKIPAGTKIHVSITGPQNQRMVGGMQQIYIAEPRKIKNVKVISSEPLKEELLWNLQAKK